MSNCKILGIVPARFGSKRVPLKNIKILGDAPLLTWTLNAAVDSGVLDTIMVSTDSDEISACATEVSGVSVPWIRPPSLATDHSSTIDVVLHTLDEYEKIGQKFDGVMILQPTSPFRTIKTIRDAVNLYLEHDCQKSVVTVSQITDAVEWSLLEVNETVKPALGWENFFKRSQDLNCYWKPTGSVYLSSIDLVKRKHGFIHDEMAMLKVFDKKENLDIDTFCDWEIAESHI